MAMDADRSYFGHLDDERATQSTLAERCEQLADENTQRADAASAQAIVVQRLRNEKTVLRRRLAEANAETAHLKTIGLWEGFSGVANLVSRDAPAELSLPSGCHTREADLVINARVAIAPDVLERLVGEAADAACSTIGAKIQSRQVQSFRPGRPEPTYRFAKPAQKCL